MHNKWNIILPLALAALMLQCGNSTVLFGEDVPPPPPPPPSYANLGIQASGLVSSITNGSIMSASLKVSNNSDTTVSDPFAVAAVLDDGSSETWVSSWSVAALDSGAEADLSVQFTIPSAVAAGSYDILFRADESDSIEESNEADNQDQSPLTVNQRADSIDLIPYELVNYSTSTGTVSVRIQNGGDGDLNAEPFTWRIYFSKSNSSLGDPDDELVYEGSNFNGSGYDSMAAGSYVDYNDIVVGTPATIGNYYLIIVVDQDNTIAEGSEANNTDTSFPFTCGLGCPTP